MYGVQVVASTTAQEREALKARGRADLIPAYASDTYDEKVDVWAVGVLAFELLVGRPPFEVKSERDTAFKIMFEEPAFPNGFPLEGISFV